MRWSIRVWARTSECGYIDVGDFVLAFSLSQAHELAAVHVDTPPPDAAVQQR